MKRILFLGLFFVCTSLCAQTGVITGRVLDSQTLEPLPFANVFVNNTTIGTTTDIDGNFVLKNVSRPSVFDLIISFVGYQSYKQKISLSDETLTLRAIKLIASEIQLSDVEVKEKRDTEWEKKLKKFFWVKINWQNNAPFLIPGFWISRMLKRATDLRQLPKFPWKSKTMR
jgi:hypothetical protein